MFGIGFSELALVGLVALVAVRPDRLPGLARTAGAWMRRARTMMETVKADVDRELRRNGGASAEDYETLKREFTELRAEISRFSRDARGALTEPAREPPARPGLAPDASSAPADGTGSGPTAPPSP
ncbi:MAG TPA: Sec-independent protein translocase protein TatB [Gammaproteobacteria bacterium]|nr:Sec-independent protein translocase protein TatB [Gammaproteobacteria bacterium]